MSTRALVRALFFDLTYFHVVLLYVAATQDIGDGKERHLWRQRLMYAGDRAAVTPSNKPMCDRQVRADARTKPQHYR
jgi:hypothetical protein